MILIDCLNKPSGNPSIILKVVQQRCRVNNGDKSNSIIGGQLTDLLFFLFIMLQLLPYQTPFRSILTTNYSQIQQSFIKKVLN